MLTLAKLLAPLDATMAAVSPGGIKIFLFSVVSNSPK